MTPALETLPLLSIQNLSLEYRLGSTWVNALHEINLILQPGEIHGLVGESGSGKSTLALAAMRYLAPNARIAQGDIFLNGESLLAKTDEQMRHLWSSQIALVPQDSLASLNPSFTVGAQIAEVISLHYRVRGRDANARAVEMLRQVRIADPERVARRYPHQLSGGMQQRVTIAMALSAHPRLLILDEPTTALDVTTQAVIVDLFRDLIRENQAAALYVSHDLGLVAQLCDQVTVLYGGEIMASAATDALFREPLHPYTISLLASLPRPIEGAEIRLPSIEGVAPSLQDRERLRHACVFSDRCPAVLDLCRREKPPLEQVSDGRVVRCHRWREIADGSLQLNTNPVSLPTVEAQPGYVLKAFDVSKTFSGGVQALSKATVQVRRRSTLGVVGESGSGKTTLARCIAALETADEGSYELLDIPLSLKLNQRPPSALRDLQMIFQNPNDALNPYRTVGDTLRRTLRRLDGSISRAELHTRVADLLKAVRLQPEYAQRYPGELSGGEKQRVAIARAFAANPALVIADEPTSALDVSIQSAVLNLLKDLRAQQGTSYLFISHNLDAVAYLADWIAVMYLGEVVETGDTRQVYNPPSHPYTEALVSAIPVADPAVKGAPSTLR